MLCVRRENTHHFNWIEFTVKLREEDAQMSLSSEDLLKEGCLVSKILLLAEKAGHAAAFVLDRANRGALGPQPSHVEATFFKLMNSNRLGRYTHIRSVCEWCAVVVNLEQKQVTAGTPVRWKELVLQYWRLTWDTSEMERTGGPGRTGYSTYTYRAYCSTQDNKACTKGK